jgi:hypothetical protein
VIMVESILIALDVFNILLVIALYILSFKVVRAFDTCGGNIPWWFGILPFVFIYGVICRILLLFSTMGMIPEYYTNIIVSAYVVFYLGLVVFMYGLYIICRHIGKKRSEEECP